MATVVNGQMGAGVLVSVGGGQALRADAAAAWLAVVAEVRARFGIVLRLTDSYRPYSVQVRIFNERYDPASSGSGPFGDVRRWGGVRYVRMRGASAAVPGTSNHGLGVAVDVTGLGGFAGSAYARLAAVAPAHGWSNRAGRQIGEAWHWEYSPAADSHPTPAPRPTPQSQPVPEEDIMASIGDLRAVVRETAPPLFRLAGGAAVWVDLGTARRHVSAGQAAAYTGPIRDLPPADPFWTLPVVARPGELYRRQGEQTGAAWLLADGGLRHVTAEEYAAMGRPYLADMPATHPLWSLPVLP